MSFTPYVIDQWTDTTNACPDCIAWARLVHVAPTVTTLEVHHAHTCPQVVLRREA